MLNFFKQFLIYGFGSILAKIAAIFLMPFYTNVLSKEEYGAMALITACKGIIDLFSNLNIHSGIARDYYEEGINREKLVSTGIYSILSFSITVLIILLITRHFFVNTVLHLNGYENAFIVMLISIPTGSMLSYFSILTRFKKKPILFTVGNIIQLIIQISISIYLVLVIKTGIVGIFIGLLAGELFGIIYYSIINREYISFSFDSKLLKRALLFSVPTLPAILAGWVDSSLGQVLIGKFVSLEQLGVYSVALQLSSVFLLISVALNNVWTPYIYENYKKQNFNLDVEKLFKIVVIFLILITLNLTLLSKEIVLLLSNSSYLNASQYFSLLCFPMGIYLLLPFVSVGVTINRTTIYLSYSYIAGSIVNLILLFLLLPKLGVIVVPICLAFSRIINYSILYQYSRKVINIKYSNILLIVFLTISIIGFVINQFNFNNYYLIIILLFFNGLTMLYLLRKYKIFQTIKQQILNR